MNTGHIEEKRRSVGLVGQSLRWSTTAGIFVMMFPLLQVAFGGAISASVLPSIGQVLLAAAFTYTSYKALTYAGEKINNQMHMENIKEAAERDADGGDGVRKKAPPRTAKHHITPLNEFKTSFNPSGSSSLEQEKKSPVKRMSSG